MIDFTDSSEFEPGELTLYFHNRRAIRAEQLSKTLSVLASEYSRFSGGRELVIMEAQSGSLRITLAALAAAGLTIVQGANDLFDFSEHLAKKIEAAREQGVKPQGRAVGTRSAAEIMKLAAESGSDVKIDYSSPDGEKLKVEINASEARRAVTPLPQTPDFAPKRIEAPRRQLPRIAAVSDTDDTWINDLIDGMKRRPTDASLMHDFMLLDISIQIIRRHGSDEAVADFATRLEEAKLTREAAFVRDALTNPKH